MKLVTLGLREVTDFLNYKQIDPLGSYGTMEPSYSGGSGIPLLCRLFDTGPLKSIK